MPVPGAGATNYTQKYHQIWYQGQPPARYDDMRNSCRLANPGWEGVLHDDASLRKLCAVVDEHDPEIGLAALYESAPTMHERIDMGRLAALFVHGGVSVDMDMFCVAGLDSHMQKVPSGAVGACCCDKGPLASLLRTGHALSFNNAVLFVPHPHSAVMLQLIRYLAQNARQYHKAHPSADATISIMKTFGPHALTAALLALPRDAVVVLEAEEQSMGSGADGYVGSAALLHMYEGTWQTSKRAHAMRRALRPLLRVYRAWKRPTEFVGACLAGVMAGAVVGSFVRR